MKIIPMPGTLGARVQEIDLSLPLMGAQTDALLLALGRYGVLEFPNQSLTTAQLKNFSQEFGSLYISPGGRAQAPGFPEVMILSNMVVNGQPLGLKDAGQSWHTDMSYAPVIALANILYGTTIPHRDGKPLGDTQFRNMHAVYEDLPEDLKQRLADKTITHDFNKFWDMMRARPGSTRPPLSETERKARPPVSHPAFLTHPLTGRKVLYANPGYAIAINGLPKAQSDAILEQLFELQLQDKYLYSHKWSQDSVLMWDNIGTTHNAVADYGPDEHRYMQRCQVMADRLFGPGGTQEPIIFHART
ncbi:TauD/TfdA dioxygenase family protein [Zwartia panacis]|jgi:taurine dioxygenase|uniref:TauD/TfdA dioxygenase family protein n=1 Tax=Zwartia panacis TaxID=2683345 RepID=UPI0025B2DE0B|nr:TauD/TfdA family dioxygenase [Zwartia panacis]MDN4017677.1 TauD/TfdA family dioxygenase [Zwartia panacis]